MSKEQVKHGLLIGICLFAVGCATNTVTPWSSSEVYYGQGGSIRNVDGIDIWEYGAPNRPFKIIAIIERGTPMSIGVALTLWNMVTMESSLVSEAKELGGDGIMKVDEVRF